MQAAAPGKVEKFRNLHKKGAAFLFPNFWDAGSAKILEGLGFTALASTSSGFALTKARTDYGVSRDEVMAHASEVCAAVNIPVAADLENGFGKAPEDCAATITLAARTGLCGGSIEDSTGDKKRPVHDRAAAIDRIAAACEAARATPNGFVLTARAEAFLYGDADLAEIIDRLNAFADAGADVLFAPGLPDIAAVRTVCDNVEKPVNVLVYGQLAQHNVEEFAAAGAARLSLGGSLAQQAYAAVAASAEKLKSSGDFSAMAPDAEGLAAVRKSIRGS